jgi:threonine/homoserine/homoserine lactone efflux protein
VTWQAYVTFCIAAAALALVPGPTVTVIVANSLRYGARAGLLNVVGTQIGVVIWLGLAALGLQVAIAAMGVWFDVLRYFGAAYLIWIGVKMLRAKGELSQPDGTATQSRNFLLQGFVVIMSNPKMLVLFGALIPPFLTAGGNTLKETMLLGGTFMLIAAAGDTLYAILASRAGQWLSKSRVRAIEIVSGICLTAGGVWMALKGR